MISGDNMKKNFNSKGFTLIEILLSLTILSIIIVPISSFFLTSQKISKDSDTNFKAITLAQSYFEMIKSMDNFEMIKSIDGIEWIGEFDPSKKINGVKSEGDFKIEVNIEPVRPVGDEDKFKKIKATNNIDDIEYDMKIVVISNNAAHIFRNGSDYPDSTINIDKELKITLKKEELKTSPKSIEISNLEKDKVNIFIELNANMNFKISNESNNNQTLVFYIIKEQNSIVNYDFNVKKGKVEKHEVIDSDENEESTDYILYYVNIKVYDKNEDNLIEDNIITDVNGYKSIY